MKAGLLLEKEEAEARFKTSTHSEDNRLAGQAIGKFCAALLTLWPWTASGLIMTPEVAFSSGLAHL